MPDYIFENKKNEENIINESEEVTIVEKIIFDKGIFLYYKDAEYPQKGMSTPDVMSSVNIIKAIFSEILKIRPNIVSILSSFNRIGMRVISQYFLKDEYRTLQMRELCNTLYHFAFSLSSDELVASQFSKIVSHLIEYDNAYRLRFIDLASELNSISLINNPKKELKRLLDIWISREVQHKHMITNKIKLAFSSLLWILKIPKVKKAFIYAIKKTNFDNLKYDNIDTYWACLRIDYNFFGLDKEARRKIIDDRGYSIPLLINKKNL